MLEFMDWLLIMNILIQSMSMWDWSLTDNDQYNIHTDMEINWTSVLSVLKWLADILSACKCTYIAL